MEADAIYIQYILYVFVSEDIPFEVCMNIKEYLDVIHAFTIKVIIRTHRQNYFQRFSCKFYTLETWEDMLLRCKYFIDCEFEVIEF